MSDEEDFSLLKRGGGRGRQETQTERFHMDYEPVNQLTDYGDPYIRDENGRPVDLLRKAHAVRRRRPEPATNLRKFFILGSILAGLLAVSGNLVPSAVVAASMLFVAVVVRLRR